MMINSYEVNLGSCIMGVPVKLHLSFFILLFIELLFSLTVNDRHWTLFVAVLYGPCLLITVIIHEFGHACMTLYQGGEVGGIVLWPLGGFALCGPTDKGAKGEFIVAIAGPITHIFQSIIWFILYIISGGEFSDFSFTIYLAMLRSGFNEFFLSICEQCVWMNIVLFSFNLLIPAYPLDGGRCLASSLIMCGVSVKRAAYITSISSMLIATGMSLLGLFIIALNKDPNGIFFALVAAYIFSQGISLYKLTKVGRHKEHPIFQSGCYDERDPTAVSDDATVTTERDTEIETTIL